MCSPKQIILIFVIRLKIHKNYLLISIDNMRYLKNTTLLWVKKRQNVTLEFFSMNKYNRGRHLWNCFGFEVCTQTNEGTKKQTYERTNEQATNERNEQTNEQTNESWVEQHPPVRNEALAREDLTLSRYFSFILN
jgi:hypothetical protein